jgi:hypothetical protein
MAIAIATPTPPMTPCRSHSEGLDVAETALSASVGACANEGRPSSPTTRWAAVTGAARSAWRISRALWNRSSGRLLIAFTQIESRPGAAVGPRDSSFAGSSCIAFQTISIEVFPVNGKRWVSSW